MNIKNLWPTERPPDNDSATWMTLLDRRYTTFSGFLEIEQQRGLLANKVSFATSEGQEMLRILLFRVVEEVYESLMAKEYDHKAEEAIDAMNYLLSMLMLDQQSFPMALLADAFRDCSRDIFSTHFEAEPLTPERVFQMDQMIFSKVAEVLRNRAWMNHPQDIYFTGQKVLLDCSRYIVCSLLLTFPNFETFWRYFIAKDEVLKFRIRSKY